MTNDDVIQIFLCLYAIARVDISADLIMSVCEFVDARVCVPC